MRRTTAEIRRAIKFEEEEAAELRRVFGVSERSVTAVLHDALADCLRWCVGDRGTEYERIMRQRNKEAVVKMPVGREGLR